MSSYMYYSILQYSVMQLVEYQVVVKAMIDGQIGVVSSNTQVPLAHSTCAVSRIFKTLC